jgi:hypothetical protein
MPSPDQASGRAHSGVDLRAITTCDGAPPTGVGSGCPSTSLPTGGTTPRGPRRLGAASARTRAHRIKRCEQLGIRVTAPEPQDHDNASYDVAQKLDRFLYYQLKSYLLWAAGDSNPEPKD